MTKSNLNSAVTAVKTIGTAALIPWGDLVEDFLDAIGVSFNDFCTEMSGGWLFGYVEALKLSGIHAVIFCISARVKETTYREHLPTGATICVLPANRKYLRLRSKMVYPYGWTVKETFGSVRNEQLWSLLKDLAPYLAAPVCRISKELRRSKCGIIICQEYEYPRFDVCLVLGRLLGIPVVATFQGGTWHVSRFERYLRPLSIKKARGLIVQTRHECHRICSTYKIKSDRIAKIFNPVDLKNWPILNRQKARNLIGIPEKLKVAIWHGRIDVHRKGLDILLRAWSLVCEKIDPDKSLLIIIGNGRDHENFRCRLRHMHAKNVKWIDEYLLNKKTIHVYLSAADVYIFSSRHEGFPVAPLEAMASGLPLVASNASGISDIFENGESDGGIIVPVENAEKLAESVVRVLENPDLAFRLGALARQRITTSFSIEAIAKQLYVFISTR